MSDIERDDIDPRWLDRYEPCWDRDPPFSREDRLALERAKRPGLAMVKPQPQAERRTG